MSKTVNGLKGSPKKVEMVEAVKPLSR